MGSNRDIDTQIDNLKEDLKDKPDHWASDGKGGIVQLPTYYNNDNGSLYKIAKERGWGVRLFDLVKRLERNGKKDPLKQEIEKSIGVLQLWLKELDK